MNQSWLWVSLTDLVPPPTAAGLGRMLGCSTCSCPHLSSPGSQPLQLTRVTEQSKAGGLHLMVTSLPSLFSVILYKCNGVWPSTTIWVQFPQPTTSPALSGTWPNSFLCPRDTHIIPADLFRSLQLPPSAGWGHLCSRTHRSSLPAADVTAAWRKNKVG